MLQNDQPKQPFFARFLEAQNKQTNQSAENIAVLTGKFFDGDRTLKYPSDGDDDDSII